MRRSAPNWLTSKARSDPFGFVKRSAGPPDLTVLSTISVTSRYGSTSASISRSSTAWRSSSIQERRSAAGTTTSLSAREWGSVRPASGPACLPPLPAVPQKRPEEDDPDYDRPDCLSDEDDARSFLGGRLLCGEHD